MKAKRILFSTLLFSVAITQAQVKIDVDVNNPGAKVSPCLYEYSMKTLIMLLTVDFMPN